MVYQAGFFIINRMINRRNPTRMLTPAISKPCDPDNVEEEFVTAGIASWVSIPVGYKAGAVEVAGTAAGEGVLVLSTGLSNARTVAPSFCTIPGLIVGVDEAKPGRCTSNL